MIIPQAPSGEDDHHERFGRRRTYGKDKILPVHTGDQDYPHVDANKRVDGKKVGDKSGHHQEQSPGYGREAVDIPVNQSGLTEADWKWREKQARLRDKQSRRRR